MSTLATTMPGSAGPGAVLTRAWLAVRLELWLWVSVIGVSLALSPLVSSLHYAVLGAGCALLVVTVGALLRAARVARPLVVLGQVVALAEWVTLVFVRDHATAGLLPNRAVLEQLNAMLLATSDQAQKFAAPVPRLHALDVTMAIAIGVLAILADLVVIALRRAALVGLLFLGVYVVPVSVLSGDVGVWSFIPGALGYVFLLAAAERDHVVRWGRHLADVDRPADAADAALRGSGLARVGRQVGLGAVACAVVLPALVPTLPTHIFAPGAPSDAVGEGGGSDVNVGNPLVDLRRNLGEQSDAELLRVRTDGSSPAYVRLTALPLLTEFGWSPGERGRATLALGDKLPAVPGATAQMAGSKQRYDVELSRRFHTRWLPVIYAPSKVDVKGAWRIDRTNLDIVAASRRYDAAGSSYSFTSRVDEPSADQLRNAPGAGAALPALLDLPADLPSEIEKQAKVATRGAQTDYDKAMALQTWFRSTGGFRYDVTPRAGSGLDTMRHFVTDDRRGYCEQFASAFAMMARTLGIPARVAVGFLRADNTGAEYVFRGTDMHAWPELYFEGAGWVRFEPTPGDSADYAPRTFAETGPEASSLATPTPSGASAAARPDQERKVGSGQAAPGTGAGAALRAHAGTYVIGLLTLLALLALPLVARTVVARRRWDRAATPSAHAEAAWLELRDRVRDLGIGWDGETTPRTTGRALAHRLSGVAEARSSLQTIVGQIERARYSRSCDDVALRDHVDAVAAALATGRPRRVVLLARWFPRSWLRGRRPSSGRQDGGSHEQLIALQE